MTHLQQQRAEEGDNLSSGAVSDQYTFRAPRFGDLVSCPYCDAETFTRCDWCGDEGFIFASEVFQ